jgi:hypothetical protein
VYCPRCGAQCKAGNKFCSSCGGNLDASLPAKSSETRSEGKLLDKFIGESRNARLLTVGTVAALVVAVVAFLALPADDGDEIPYDAYTRAADEICVAEKEAIVAAGQRSLTEPAGGPRLAAYAGGLVPVLVEWRSAFDGLSPPADRAEAAEGLSLALRRVSVEAGALARVARTLGPRAALVRAKEVDAATAEVEQAVDELGLSRCADLGIGVRN